MGEAELKASLDRLFAAPLGDFIAVRKSLAKELRDQGHGEAAAALAAAHKPTASAWAVNQVVREHRDVIGRFLAAADAARGAQRDVKKLREALLTLSAVSAQVVELARGALDAAGVAATPTHIARVEGTLKTVPLASDEDRERLALGHLSHDLDLSGDIGAFGEGGESSEDVEPSGALKASPGGSGPVQRAQAPAATTLPSRPIPAVASLDEARKAKAKAERAERDRAERAARERAALAADEEARRLEARADEAAAQLASLRQQADAASRAAQEAGARVEAASREASAARDEARQARARAEQARRLGEK
jgi:hypothetical protein